jgi:hypothetical protein
MRACNESFLITFISFSRFIKIARAIENVEEVKWNGMNDQRVLLQGEEMKDVKCTRK